MKARVATALIALPVVVAAVFFTHPLPLFLLANIIFAVSASEYLKLARVSDKRLLPSSIVLFAVLSLCWSLFRQGQADYIILIVASLLSCLSLFIKLKAGQDLGKPPFIVMSEMFGWIGCPLIALLLLHGADWKSTTWDFKNLTLMALVPLWCGDIAGIFVGMAFGKHKFAPSISPKKTVEGGIGNFVAAVVAAYFLGRALGVSVGVSLSCGACIGLLGQIGDLFESWMKRRVDVKDSGTILPGHGGILDRIDSMLFTAIPVALLLSIR
ncbi:MAG TPA: phosphatidate cytidylyltransferase [Fimbriimonadaceae bacterium]